MQEVLIKVGTYGSQKENQRDQAGNFIAQPP
jgi:hypothetical protein